MTSASETEAIAARWLMKQEDEGWSDQDQSALEAWLDADDGNKVAFWRLECGWREASRMSALGGSQVRRSRSLVRGAMRRPVAAAAAIVLALSASIVLAVALAPSLGQFSKSYATQIGDRRSVSLGDGSRLELNTATKVRVAVEPDRRVVWLDQGEAYFEVAHDAKHPFVVHAGPKTITVLGTRFSVRRDEQRVEVAVIEGRVRVNDTDARQIEPPKWIMQRGDLAVSENASMLVTTGSVRKVENALSWRRGVLTFDQVTLTEAVEEFNRYNSRKLVVVDSDVADMRIGGSFEAANAEAFARLLQRGFGLKMEYEGDEIRISG